MRPVLLALAIVVLAAPAHARSLRLFDDGPVVAASTDGWFVAATRSGAVGAGVRVLDTRTGKLRSVDTPPECTFAAVGAGSLLWNCGDSTQPSGRTLNLRSGAVGALPVLAPESATSEDSAAYVSLGRRWAGAVRGGYHYAFPVYVRRTGGLERRAPRAANVVADLDAPGLERTLCAPVRRPEVDDVSGLGTVLAPELARRGGVSVSIIAGDSVLRVVRQRCGHPPRVVRRCPPGECSSFDQPVLAGGRALWIEGERLRTVSLRGGAITAQRVGPGAHLIGSAGRRVYLVSGHRLRHVTLG